MKNPKVIASLLLIFILAASPMTLYAHSSSLAAGPNWLFTGSEFNYSQKTVTKQPTYGNVSVSLESFKISSVTQQSFNYTESVKSYSETGAPQDKTLAVNASIVIPDLKELGTYPGGSFFVVNSTVLKLIAENSTLYFNYRNASAPLNISKTNYTYDSSGIPSYRLSAIEPPLRTAAPSQSQNTVVVEITLFIDSSNGVVLYENENQTYPETFFVDTVYTIDGSNFQMLDLHSPPSSPLILILAISLMAVIAIAIIAVRLRRR